MYWCNDLHLIEEILVLCVTFATLDKHIQFAYDLTFNLFKVTHIR